MMKRWLLISTLMLANFSFSQEELFSFYFHEDGIFVLESVRSVNPRLFGKYELTDLAENEVRRAAGENLVVDESGVYLEKNRLLSISREEVRENSQYRVSKGWLHGVIENDSVPCALDEEMYYFLIPVKTYLYGSRKGPERLVPISGSRYGIFSQEGNGFFSGIILNFSQNGVSLNEIVFSKHDPNNIEKIETSKTIEEEGNDFSTYILSPTVEEWNKFIFARCYQTYDSYSMVNDQ
jgi:hypothetical protein